MVDYAGPARLVDEAGAVFEVYVTLMQRVGRGGISSWDGAVQSRTGEPLFLNAGHFTLRMPDGREGIVIAQAATSWRRGSGISERIKVDGSGPAPF